MKRTRSHPEILSVHNGESCETLEVGDTVFSLQTRLTEMMIEQRWEILIDHIISGKAIAEVALSSKEHPLTLLHIACTIVNIPTRVILEIIKLNPNALLTQDEDGSLPIHLACVGGLSLQVIEALMIGCPKSCLQTDHQGEIPLCYILMNNNASTDIEPLVSTLISRLPPSCIYNESTSLLHEIRDGICHEGIIKQVIRMHPRVCHIQNENGDTLLHLLCYQKKPKLKIIRMVIKCNSLACATPDNDGNLPLHLVNSHQKIKAIFKYSDLTAIRHLSHTKNKLGLVPVQAFFYKIQRVLTKFITCSRQDTSSLSLNSKYNHKMSDKITSLFLLIRAYEYGSVDEVGSKRRLLVPHELPAWTMFYVFIKVLMQRYPHIAKEQIIN